VVDPETIDLVLNEIFKMMDKSVYQGGYETLIELRDKLYELREDNESTLVD
jgi:hypothetical protein